MTSQLVLLQFSLGNICIIPGGLVKRTHFQKVQHILLPFLTVRFGKLPHL